MDPLIQKIEELLLTPSESRVADFIIDHLDTVGLYTSRALADSVGVSDTSVIRLVHKLGFETYTQFRGEMNARITRQYKSPLTPEGQAMEDYPQRTQTATLHGSILESLQKTFARVDDAVVRQIVDILLQSKHKYIAGFHTTASCAQYMATRLVKLLPHVIPVVNADASSVETILDIGPEDCLLVYSFLRYAKINAALMKLAKQNGAKIILITDRLVSPLARKADIVLLTPIDSSSQVYSYVAPLSVSEMVLMTLIAESGSDGEARMHRLEHLLESAELY